MAKISFNKLGLKKNVDIKLIEVNGVDVEIKQYLPIEEKISLIELIAQESIEFNFINPAKLEKYLHLYFIYKYTNISFTDKQRETEEELYDMLESAGVIDLAINSCEDYYVLREYLEDYVENYSAYQNTFYGIVSKIITDIPESLEEAVGMLDKLDFEKLGDTLKLVSDNVGSPEALFSKGQKQ